MHSFIALLAAAATVSATYVEPYQSDAYDYKEATHTVMDYHTYQRRAVKYQETYSTPAPYSSDPPEYTPTPYPSASEAPYPYESYSSSSSSMPPPSFIDNTGVGSLDENLDKLPVKRGYKAKTYGTPPSYSSPAPTPYHSEEAYDPSYYSVSSSSSSMAPEFLSDIGAKHLDLPVRRGEYKKTYATPYTTSAAPSYSAEPSYSYSYSYSASSSSSSAPAGSAAAGGLPGLGGLLGGLPIRRHEPTGSAAAAPASSSPSSPLGGLGGVLGDLPLA